MKKEGVLSSHYNKEGRINSAFLLVAFILFVLTIIAVQAVTVRLTGPGNLTFNDTRNINFTFNVTWDLLSESYAGINCSIYSNVTSPWQSVAINNSQSNISNWSTEGGLGSVINYTFPADGNYTWSVGCLNTAGGTLTFPVANRTVFIDTVAPRIIADTPKGVLTLNTQLNITSNSTGVFYVNISDNSTRNVWLILNRASTALSFPNDDSSGDFDYNETVNRTMTLDAKSAAGDYQIYNFSLMATNNILNFSGNFTSPGPHGVFFCANDSLGRVTCSQKYDYIIKGVIVDDMERMFKNGQVAHPTMGFSFTGLDIRYGNGTDVPAGSFMDPTTGNFTFNMNFTGGVGIFVVGAKIDENSFGNMSSTNYSAETTLQSRQAAGTRMRSNLTWIDVKSFIPSDVSYDFGIIQMPDVYDKVFYCNGTSSNNPGCFVVSECNATVFDNTNSSRAIPNNSACWLKSGSWGKNPAETTLTSGFTYLFVDHFSGGLGANDFSAPNITFVSPGGGPVTNRSTVFTQAINFIVEDLNSTGLNLTKNSSVTVTIYQSQEPADRGIVVAFFNYTNSTNTNLSCFSTTDTISLQNTTSITCNTTFTFTTNGSYTINVTGFDTSNNSNQFNVTGGVAKLILDQTPPLISYFNITNSTRFNTQSGDGNITTEVKTFENNDQGSIQQGSSFFVIANWTDNNLTTPYQAVLQMYNTTTSSWVTYNGSSNSYNFPPLSDAINNLTINISPQARRGWSNFTFTIPQGHNLFEGKNVSFRIIANDTLGNVNTTAGVLNITVQINDTTLPTISIPNGTAFVNGTNTSDTTPTISWQVTEGSAMNLINVSVNRATHGGTGENSCKTSAIYTTASGPANVERNRNGTFTVLDDPACTLGNGTHYVNITATDIWGNRVVTGHTFSISSGSVPAFFFNLTNDRHLSWSKSAVNNSNITSSVGLGVGGADGLVSGSNIKNITWVSSCDSSTTYVTSNNTIIFPFNLSSACRTTDANRTVRITVTDTAENSNTTVLGFLVDNTGPSIAVNSPRNGQVFSTTPTSPTDINISILDTNQAPAFIGFYLDLFDSSPLYTLNISGSITTEGQNFSSYNQTNFTAGTHRIKFTTNDTLGNVMNSSIITFTQIGPINFGGIKKTLTDYDNLSGSNLTNVSVRVLRENGYVDITAENSTSDIYELLFELNTSSPASINVSLRDFNGSAANWNKINFTPLINDTPTINKLKNNWTNSVLRAVTFNNTISQFLSDNDSYYGVVEVPFNISGTHGSAQQFWWLPDSDVLSSKQNISVCTSAFTKTSTTPCFNYTKSGRSIIFVPHYSIVAVVNDSTPPTLSLITPSSTLGNHSVGAFVPNFSVSSDAVECNYKINGTAIFTMTPSNGLCTGQLESFKNLDSGYNITFNATDGNRNSLSFVFRLNVSDVTAPNTPNTTQTSSSVGSTTATITITGMNETVNATILYGTGVSSISSRAHETDFNQSQSVSITSLTASTIYYYNVSVCDYNGNCATNGTFNFTTDAATAAAAAAAAASSSSGGGGGVAADSGPQTIASTTRVWDSVAAGTSTELSVNKPGLAVSSVAFTTKSDVANAELSVSSLSAKPANTGDLTTQSGAAVYQYLEITAKNLPTGSLESATIGFTVPASWMSQNGINKEDVVLYHYTGGQWVALSTTYLSDDSANLKFSAATTSFSPFAIGAKKATESKPAEETKKETTEKPSEPAIVGTTTSTAGTAKATEKKPMGTWIIAAIVALVIVAVVVVMMRRNKN